MTATWGEIERNSGDQQMTTRTAQCGCGRAKITVEGDPIVVCACHCDFCQKRTGSVFAVQAYFSTVQWIETQGKTKVYNRLEVDGVGPLAGDTPDYHFCTTCGSTLYWTVKGWSGAARIGIAVGNFVDPAFPPPSKEVYTSLRHRWIAPVVSVDQFSTFPEEQNRDLRF
jgi:hypothetical protein